MARSLQEKIRVSRREEKTESDLPFASGFWQAARAMAERPEIFISATTRDLKSSRQIVRDALLTMGCVPIVQDHFAPDARTVREMLRARIAACDAVLHLVGECYGAEPQERAAGEARRSYTQMEYDMARELGKPLYLFLCAPDFLYDAHVPEDDERRALQDQHRATLTGGDYVYLPINDARDLDLRVRELQPQIPRLAAHLEATRSWLGRGVAVAVGVLLLIGAALFVLQRRAADIQGQAGALQQQNQAQAQQLDTVRREAESLHRKLDEQTQTSAQILAAVQRLGPGGQSSDPLAAAQTEVAQKRGISVEDLQKELTGEKTDVRRLLGEIDERATALAAQAEQWRRLKRDALVRLGNGEFAAGHFAAAVDPYRQAVFLSDENKEPLAWCDAAQKLEGALASLTRYAEAEPLARQIMDRRTALQGAEHPATLDSVKALGNLLDDKGDPAGAEPLYRRCLEARERTLGREHRDTLGSLNDLASLLEAKGDYTAAEPLYRQCLEAQERTLGKEHRDTLITTGNLAILLDDKGDPAAAEPLYRRCLEVEERILGREHRATLKNVNNLAGLLCNRGDYAEAEPLFRRGLEAQERTLGKDHADTLTSVSNLAYTLYKKGDYTGAEPLFRRCVEGFARTLGKENVSTLVASSNLAQLLAAKGDPAAAEPLFLQTEAGMERAFPPEHPSRLELDDAFSRMRQQQGRLDEALALAEHAAAGAGKSLPEDNADRRKYERHLQELQAKKVAAVGKTGG